MDHGDSTMRMRAVENLWWPTGTLYVFLVFACCHQRKYSWLGRRPYTATTQLALCFASIFGSTAARHGRDILSLRFCMSATIDKRARLCREIAPEAHPCNVCLYQLQWDRLTISHSIARKCDPFKGWDIHKQTLLDRHSNETSSYNKIYNHTLVH